jgi:penicillin-binding protein 2
MVLGSHRHRRWAGLIALAVGLSLIGSAAPSSAQAPARGKIVDRRGRTLASTRGGERVYPRGPVAAHVLAGVERSLAAPLEGGSDVVLTLDLDMQKVAHGALMKHEAAAVAVVEVETGRILALVSTPEGDPRQADGDRATARAYPPASTFKLITAVAGLETGISPEEENTCTGHRTVGRTNLQDMGVHGTIDFIEALQHSCNVYFWSVGERVGLARLATVARDFGFGEPTGLDIPGEVAGHVPNAAEYPGDSEHDLVMRLQSAIGLAGVRATVLQVAMAYATLANGGRLYQAQIVRRVERSGEPAEERQPVLRRHVSASAATLEVIRRGLYRAVNRRGGTAFAAKKGVVKMVGKTGTAFMPYSRDESHAWFAGWAPADNPKVAIAVLVENGGIGGAVAAPVARDIIDAYYLHAAREKRAERREAMAAKKAKKSRKAEKSKLAQAAKAKAAKAKAAKAKAAKAKAAKEKAAKAKAAKAKAARARAAKKKTAQARRARDERRRSR